MVRSRRMWSTSIHGYISNTPSDTEELAEHQVKYNIHDHQKRMYRIYKTSRTKEAGKKRLSRLTWPWRCGELKQESNTQIRALVWVREETFESESETAGFLTVWNGMRINIQLYHSHMYPRQEYGSPRRHSGGKPEYRDCGVIRRSVLPGSLWSQYHATSMHDPHWDRADRG